MEQKNPIVVYLDSSDYSVLSDPRRSSKTEETRKLLVGLARSPGIVFAFSGIHISEMAPLESKYTAAAAARTDLMVELCNRNTFISYDRIIKAEMERLSSMREAACDPLIYDGTWFPEIGELITPSKLIGVTAAINEKGMELGLNRKDRRSLKSKTSRHAKFRSTFIAGMGDLDLDSILDRYPMRPKDASIIADYVIGKATAEQADNAFLESMRDPRWMMRWFHEHHDQLGVVGDWVRAPASRMIVVLSGMIDAGNKLIRFEKETGIRTGIDFLSAEEWENQSKKMSISVANRLIQSEHPDAPLCMDASLIERYCPGFSSLIGVINDSLRNSFGPRARKLTRSDFADALHAMYAPYTSVFRADRYMAPIVRNRVAQYGTSVVESVDQVPSVIQRLMSY